MPGPAVTSAPSNRSTASGVTSSAPHYPPGVHGYVADTKGRMHPIDEYGFRIRKSNRPQGFMPDEWNKLSGTAKRKILETLDKEPALAAAPKPEDY